MSALPPFAELRRAAPGFAQRQAKTLRQARFGWAHPRRVGFVFGCQRSGTKLVMRVLDRAPDIRIFHENHASGFEDFKLRSDPVIRALIALNPAPVQVFKPICDSHEADHILQRFPDARGVWVVRNAADVANSAVKKWGDHQRQLVESLLAGDEARWGWRMARVPADARAEVAAAAAGAPLTDAEGALLFWYLRNRFFFSLGLDRDPRMRLIRYDALARDPEPQFAALFDHLGAPFDPACIDRVRGDSVGRAPAPAARPAIQALCDALTARFEAWTPAPLPLPSPVLLLIDSLSVGGAERYVVTVANWLDDHGVKVTVASGGGSLAAGLRPGVRQVEGELDGVRAGLPRAAWLIHKVLREGGHRAVICSSVATTLIARAAAPSGQAPIFNVAHGWPAAGYPRVGKALRAADRKVGGGRAERGGPDPAGPARGGRARPAARRARRRPRRRARARRRAPGTAEGPPAGVLHRRTADGLAPPAALRGGRRRQPPGRAGGAARGVARGRPGAADRRPQRRGRAAGRG